MPVIEWLMRASTICDPAWENKLVHKIATPLYITSLISSVYRWLVLKVVLDCLLFTTQVANAHYLDKRLLKFKI